MKLKNNTDWNLLAKFMAGETDAKENSAVEIWAKNSPDNKALLHEIQTDWKKMDGMNAKFDVDNAWNKLHNRIASDSKTVELPVTSRKIKRNYFSLPMRIAASLLLLAILGISVAEIANKVKLVTVTASVEEKGKSVELPDGSKVYMNSGARLSYSKQFGHKNREVQLTGEAFFDVTPDKNKPFSISAGNAMIRVLGTSFNVNSGNNKNQVEVYVSTGIVELSESVNQNNRVLIHPGNIGLIEDSRIKMLVAENANSIAWKTGAMTFTDAPLTEVIALLNNVYNVNITLKGDGIDTIRINGSYRGDPLDRILAVISAHNPQLIIAKSEDTIYLSQ